MADRVGRSFISISRCVLCYKDQSQSTETKGDRRIVVQQSGNGHKHVNAPDKTERSLAAKASWVSLGLAVGCVCAFVVFEVIDETIGFAHNTPRGVLSGFLPRTALWVMWAGMGLAVIKKEVERHGGNITIESTPDHRGTEFHFTWMESSEKPLINNLFEEAV